jgi:phosphohistidine phosphatase
MNLYIVRHGIAEEGGDGPDEERALTAKGAARMEQAARGLRRLKCRPARVLTSPLVRAEQTARIVAEVLCPRAPFVMCEQLAPGAPVGALLEELADVAEDSVLLVGHNPDVARLAARLLCGRGKATVVFKKGAACCISFEAALAPGAGRLDWLLQPGQLRALGRKG